MTHLNDSIRNKVVDRLPEILSLHGVSGREEQVQSYLTKELESLADSVTVDPLGNVISHIKGNGKQKLMVAAHMDEIGLMIKHIDQRGFLYFETIGGIRSQNLYARECEVLTPKGKVPGIVNSIHPGRPLADEYIPDAKDFFIDVGANNLADIENMGIEVGQSVKFIYQFQQLNNKVAGTALDNRLLVFILLEVLKVMKNEDQNNIPDLYPVFTVQEEVGSRGAQTATNQIKPDLAIALDITMANDLPKIHESEHIAEVDRGPGIKVVDNISRAMLGLIVSDTIVKQMKDIAHSHHIPYQLEVQSAGSTDGATIHREGNGVPTGGICLPTRYVHAYELASIDDTVHMANLLYESIKTLKVY
ncbi:M42 family metallopeptidase [Tuberibacillus sp. Marseille-P3662]|uniref:M42 family metallopeptidase n=1 Tax=Tuberibacillus sp. Marseille-P3662 TaxID=1965358 RepID=UPI0015948240|nr:M42 family peptidase [Tuberibacillus sp. Marseille-P3662]